MTNLSAFALHPRSVLLAAQASRGMLPVCDHYSGVEARMRKSLQLQAEMTEEFGACVFDVTLDCEDGALAAKPNTPRWLASWPCPRLQKPAWACAFIPWITPHSRKTWLPSCPAPGIAWPTSCCPRWNRFMT